MAGAPVGNKNAVKDKKRLVISLSLSNERQAWVEQYLQHLGQEVSDEACRRFVRQLAFERLDALMRQAPEQ